MHIVNAKIQLFVVFVYFNTTIAMDLRSKHLDFIEHLKVKARMSVSAIAHEAGVSDSTLTRFISKDNYKNLSSATLDKIAKVGGYKSYEDYLVEKGRGEGGSGKKNIEISDGQKFEIYEMVKRLSDRHEYEYSPDQISEIALLVIKNAENMNTNFITDSLVMYVIEVYRSSKS